MISIQHSFQYGQPVLLLLVLQFCKVHNYTHFTCQYCNDALVGTFMFTCGITCSIVDGRVQLLTRVSCCHSLRYAHACRVLQYRRGSLFSTPYPDSD